jgi:hypothetical protein
LKTAPSAGEQLVVEPYTSTFRESVDLFGCELARDEGDFAELGWENSLLLIEEVKDAPQPPAHPVGNKWSRT